MKENADLLFTNAEIYTQDCRRTILQHADLAVTGNKIADVGTGLSEKYHSVKTIDATGKTIFPGMHNMHVHIFQSLLKGLGVDMKLIDWCRHATQNTGPYMSPELYELACKIAVMECLRSGVTTLCDFNYLQQTTEFAHVSIQTMEEVGIRGIYMDCYHDTGENHGVNRLIIHPSEECISRADALIGKYNGKEEHPLTEVWPGISVNWGATDTLIREMAEYSADRRIPWTMHILETEDDNTFSSQVYGMPLVKLLKKCDALSERLLAVHCVQLTQEEIPVFSDCGVNVVYCPMANTYLGSGIPPIAAMNRSGVNVTIGTDGAASNNSSDMIESLKMGLLLQKGAEKDPTALRAQDMLDMATINAAKAEHRSNIGSIETGKIADFFVFDPYFARSVPNFNTLSTLMYNSSTENVEMTVVNGKIVFEHGVFCCGLDERSVAVEADRKAKAFAAVQGILDD